MASLGFLLFYFWKLLVSHLKGIQLWLPELSSLPLCVWGTWDTKSSAEVWKKGPLLGWDFALWWETAGAYLKEPDSSKPVPMEMTDTCSQGRYLGPWINIWLVSKAVSFLGWVEQTKWSVRWVMSAGYCGIRSFLHQVTGKPKAACPLCLCQAYFRRVTLLLCLWRGKLSLDHFPLVVFISCNLVCNSS